MKLKRGSGRRPRVVPAVLAAALLAVSTIPAAHAAPAMNALYVGYYQEDPIDNPEDPTMGSVYVALPSANGRFAGNMYFTYVGCQHSNVGKITGAKTAATLVGTWSGTLDGTSQHGNFTGKRLGEAMLYRGAYTVAGGKQHIGDASCLQYYVASKGSFELFSAGSSNPAGFSIEVHDGTISWKSPAGAAITLVSVIDPAAALEDKRNATLWQTLVFGPQAATSVRAIGLVKGRRYVATVSVADARSRRISFGSTPFVAL